MTAKKPPRDDGEQSKLFLQKARELGADQTESGADELLSALHRKPPELHEPLHKKRGKGTRTRRS